MKRPAKFALAVAATIGGIAPGWGGEARDNAARPWTASVSEGWDSLYMYRGVNQLPAGNGYGSGLAWSSLSVSWTPTEADTVTASTWLAFGLGGSDYKECDVNLGYERTLGPLRLSFGYALYAVLSAPGGLFCHEIALGAESDVVLGPVTVTPSLRYAVTLGPSPEHGGYVSPGSGYLEARVDAAMSLIEGLWSFAPWLAAGGNLGYNTRLAGDGVEPFTGANHLEAGISLPVTVTAAWTVFPYAAFSRAWAAFPGTRPHTFWGGIAVTVSF